MVQRKFDNGLIRIREHPTYAMANESAAIQQTLDYATDLKRSKIVLVGRSSRNFALRKYPEAAMAGALVVGDIPDERMNEFRSWIVEADYEESDETLLNKVKHWLANENERVERARRGQLLNAQLYSYDRIVDQMIDTWHAYLNGERGMIHPHEFKLNLLTGDLVRYLLFLFLFLKIHKFTILSEPKCSSYS